ncbi:MULTISPECIES: hypothetical protein [unclassified Streptomyces]|uniref:hypothetical protein n=1 Tax=unclassified Streptomyces TaxID=2593676 RepID=UPI002DD845A3|nr:hypothetical protein [Streptomyces sp. NBC_01750]WSB02314.1 hypothetical protein OIE54_25335 [Streptomyces sp. NBC_01794]WSD33416.1 hypothetical protein OG966_16780 [Streptomyces sp. NBC_01750]
MSEITGTAKVHEAYAFACMHCGHGWEQSYEIEHHVDATGQEFVVYTAAGARVPSPLSSPNCLNCGGHVVRIMRSGQVSSVRNLMSPAPAAKKSVQAAAAPRERESVERPPLESEAAMPEVAGAEKTRTAEPHHWHLSDLLHPFHHRK